MNNSFMSTDEKIIKSKNRVQNHGEVFTPKRTINKMLNLPEIADACENLTSTFLEPAVGEGGFLVEILNRKLNMVAKKYGYSLISYENYSLLALSTLYGIELLEDNAQKCVMNMYQAYYEAYEQLSNKYWKNMNPKVLNSAKLIISKNIIQGNFLTKLSTNGKPLVFSEWKATNLDREPKILKVQRTEYTLDDILEKTRKESGEVSIHSEIVDQLDLFYLLNNKETLISEEKQMKYVLVKIVDVYKEEKEEINE